MTIEEQPPLSPQMELTPGDLFVLSLLGQQRALSLDQLPHFIKLDEGLQSTSQPESLKSTAHHIARRLQRAGLLTIQLVGRTHTWTWLTKAGLRSVGLSTSRKAPTCASLPALQAASDIRLFLSRQYPRGVWVSREQLRRQRAEQKLSPFLSLPTAAFETGEGDYLAIHVLLRWTGPEEHLVKGMREQLQLEASPAKPSYTGVWYYVPAHLLSRLSHARAQVVKELPEETDRLCLFSYPLVPTRVLHRGHRTPVVCTAWSPDGARIASASRDLTLQVWSAAKGTLHFCRQLPDIPSALAWSPNGQWIATADQGGGICFWDASTGEHRSTAVDHTQMVTGLAWSPSGEALIASCSVSGRLQMLNFEQGSLQWEIQGHPDGAWALAWSPDGRRLAVGGDDACVRIYDAITGQWKSTFVKHGELVSALTWSPDSQCIASAGDDFAIQIWDAQSGEEMHLLDIGTWISSLAWSPDGARLAWIEEGEESVLVWQRQTGKLQQISGGHGHQLNGLAWSPESTQLVSGSTDGTVHLYRVSGDRP